LWALFQAAVALSHCGDSAAAQAACAEAIRLASDRGETWARAEAMWASGLDRWVAGDRSGTAAALVKEALSLTPNANDVSIVLGIELLAWIEGSGSNHAEAARLLGAAAARWNALGTTIGAFGPVFARYSGACRAAAAAALGESRFRALLQEGSGDPQRAARLSGRPCDPVSQLSEPDLAALTKRERDVARLIAKGLTNKAIAAELVLSPRTVDGHVIRLFAKIGVSTRAQAAVWMSEHEGLA
jgi:DNA-binding CsgD family transcriptional regulator